MLFAIHRNRSGFVASTPDNFGGFVLTDEPRAAVRFWTRAAAERFKAKHRAQLGGGWKVVPAGRLARLLGLR